MADARDRQVWEPIAQLTALLFNIVRKEGAPPKASEDFIPERLGGWTEERKAEWWREKASKLPKKLTPEEKKRAWEKVQMELYGDLRPMPDYDALAAKGAKLVLRSEATSQSSS